MTPYVRYEVADGCATITLDSPHNRNAISAKLLTELHRGLADAATDPAVRAVVLTHTGNTFCAGADLAEASGSAAPQDPAAAAAQRTQGMVDLLRAFLELPKPIIAALDGHVRAGGMGIVGACDLVVAGPKSTFALTEVRLGLAASIISLTLLPRMSPRAVSRYFLTGEKFDAAQAEQIGLITIAAADPEAAVAGLVAELRKCSPQGLAESKVLANTVALAGFDAAAQQVAAQSARLFGTPEAMEGMMSFLQKRPASWAE
ncbi:enoyl-CoA hydratase family protein [Tomitella biformata]|uniref:enoyl-CoA hydratase family protein n=1 Tax=Tomitella biformata TaxID=630403 RepID=UPI000462EBFF|nr:enoyl-CoA hydratase family protein [Tomitella biformata]